MSMALSLHLSLPIFDPINNNVCFMLNHKSIHEWMTMLDTEIFHSVVLFYACFINSEIKGKNIECLNGQNTCKPQANGWLSYV